MHTKFGTLVVFFIVLITSSIRAVSYSVTEFGTFGGDWSVAFGINSSGQVSGWAATPDDVSHAFIFINGSMQILDNTAGTLSAVSGINDAGQTVGRIGSTPILFDGSTKQQLPWIGGDANGINNAGQIVGSTFGIAGHAVLYSNDVIQDLGTLGGRSSTAFAINATGQIVGSSDVVGDVNQHAFLYSNNVMQDLGTLPGGAFSRGFGINASGQVVGYSDSADAPLHAFLCTDRVMQDLGTLVRGGVSHAYGINDAGEVVGDDDALGHAFLYSDGVMQDLNDLIEPASGFTLNYAYGINDSGQIVGSGTDSLGQQRGYLLTVVPEPGTLALLTVAGVALLAGRRRTR